jgi:molybdenum cofactor biosynthesis protein MoaC
MEEPKSDNTIPGMVDVSAKPDTLRSAIAKATVRVSPSTITIIKEGKSPKGDIIDSARVAATMGAKKTWDLLPYCHPLPLDSIKVEIEIKQQSVEITVNVKTVWKTGVEMEALTGASIAALTVYDMLKPVDENLSIESIRLVEKHGGIGSFAEEGFDKKLKAAVLVASDSRKEKDDRSGKTVANRLVEYGFDIVDYKVVTDDADKIVSELKRYCDELKVNLVITTGGTGLGPRDVTPEATNKVIEKQVPGIPEAARVYGQKRTPLSMLSRGVAGVRGKTVIINLPGSTKSVTESLDALFPGLLHVFKMLEGLGHSSH